MRLAEDWVVNAPESVYPCCREMGWHYCQGLRSVPTRLRESTIDGHRNLNGDLAREQRLSWTMTGAGSIRRPTQV